MQKFHFGALAALAALSIPGAAFAAPQAKQDICHWDADAELFKVINISGNAVSAHLNHGDVMPGAWYADADGDSFGNPAGATDRCPNDGFVDNASDCDDANPAIFPGAQEICGDNIDNNCSGAADENCAFRSCKELLVTMPGTGSGNYLIDKDGAAGPLAPKSAYCDMDYQGGGWTNLNFSAKTVELDNGNYVYCNGGLTATATAFTCKNPVFNGYLNMPLYHYYCSGTDNSAKYILDHMSPWIGHNQSLVLGFTGLGQQYTGSGTPQTSTGMNEFCYVNGQVIRYDNPACWPYSNNANGNCIPNYFTLSL